MRSEISVQLENVDEFISTFKKVNHTTIQCCENEIGEDYKVSIGIDNGIDNMPLYLNMTKSDALFFAESLKKIAELCQD